MKVDMKSISDFLRMVHMARNKIIASTTKCEMVVNGLIAFGSNIRSLTKPVHVASQKPMKNSRCRMNLTSNFMILAHYLSLKT